MKKETIYREYVTNGLTQQQIAEKYNVSRTTIVRRMQEHGIKPRPKHKNQGMTLTLKQEQFLFGKILGDGSIYKGQTSTNHRLGFAHKDTYKDYVFYCYEFIKDWCNTEPTYRVQKRDPKIYKQSEIHKYVLESRSHPEFSRLHRYFYEHGRKVVNKDILDSLTPLSLAIWYQDDGSIEVNHRVNKVTGAKLHTNQFPKESVELICDWLYETYDINSNINRCQLGKDGIQQYGIRVAKRSLEKFFKLMEPYIVDCMRYKITIDRS